MKTWVLLAMLTVSGGRCAEESPQDEPDPLQDTMGQLISSLQAVMDQFTASLQTLEAKVTANQRTLEAITANQRNLEANIADISHVMDALKLQVGFSVTVARNMMLDGPGQKVMFTIIDYNRGQAYSPTTGDFTAPVAGMYSFSFKFESGIGKSAMLHMMKEGLPVLYLYGHDRDSSLTPSADVVLHLDQGQRVWVETFGNFKSHVNGFTRFGGFLVKPDV